MEQFNGLRIVDFEQASRLREGGSRQQARVLVGIVWEMKKDLTVLTWPKREGRQETGGGR